MLPWLAGDLRVYADVCSPRLIDGGGRPENSVSQAQQALSIAREVDDPALLARALTAWGLISAILLAEPAAHARRACRGVVAQ